MGCPQERDLLRLGGSPSLEIRKCLFGMHIFQPVVVYLDQEITEARDGLPRRLAPAKVHHACHLPGRKIHAASPVRCACCTFYLQQLSSLETQDSSMPDLSLGSNLDPYLNPSFCGVTPSIPRLGLPNPSCPAGEGESKL